MAAKESLQLFLSCASGVERLLDEEIRGILPKTHIEVLRGGVALKSDLEGVMKLNLESRLAQRVLIELISGGYRHEDDIYALARRIDWTQWITPAETIRVDTTARHSPLRSLNFANLRVKDAICDTLRDATGERPSVDTRFPDLPVMMHLSETDATLYVDTSGEPLFKRGWREDKGEAPLKETLAAAMIAASGWADGDDDLLPLYDPCCGSGTIAIEAAQIACNIAPGSLRHFAFEKYLPFQAHVWSVIKQEAADAVVKPQPGQKALIYGSDVAHRMVDFAQRNAERAGVADVIEFRGGDALQRMPPSEVPGVMLLNPPYGERIAVAGVAGAAHEARTGARELAQTEDGGEFFSQLATHWKKNYSGWTGWILTPDLKLPSKMRLKESRRVPMWNGPIECRMFRFDMVKGAARERKLSGGEPEGKLGSDHRQQS